jgi:phosphatidylglycerol:prolipoprotein diacylglycerol transferase
MRPILFHWRGRNIHSYHVLLYLGILSGVIVGNYVAQRARLNPGAVFITMLLLPIPALVGARLLFISTHWQFYRRERQRIWRRSEGGLSVYGGLLAVFVSIPIVSSVDVPFAAFWDVSVFSILIGLTFCRLGCLLNGCCAGKPHEGFGALCLPNEAGVWRRRIPTQILEVGWLLLLLGGAASLWKQIPFAGGLFLCALAAYGAGRLVLNNTREQPSSMSALRLKVISALAVLIGFAFLLIAER